MQGSATAATAPARERRGVSGKAIVARLARVVLAGIFLAVTGVLVPVVAIYSFIWIARLN